MGDNLARLYCYISVHVRKHVCYIFSETYGTVSRRVCEMLSKWCLLTFGGITVGNGGAVLQSDGLFVQFRHVAPGDVSPTFPRPQQLIPVDGVRHYVRQICNRQTFLSARTGCLIRILHSQNRIRNTGYDQG